MQEFKPTEKQALFLASDDDICMMAGGAGSGKSYVMLWDALGLNDTEFGPRFKLPYYRALIFRKQFRQLQYLIDTSKTIYPMVDPGAVFKISDSTWTFSSGAKICISYFETYDQVETLQGISYAYIGIDEIGTYEDDRIFKYSLSRLRSPEGLKPYLRATSNPSRYRWLRDFFRIERFGASTHFKIDYTLKRGNIKSKSVRYIQAMLKDNPYLGEEYEAQLMMLPIDEQNALLNGDWCAYETVEGQVFEHEIKKMNEEHRYCNVPYDPSIPVYTFWDIGSSDMTVILFVQFVGKEIRIIDMLKDNNKGLNDYYMPQVMKKKDDLGYIYGGHYLPHDSGKREWTNNTKIIDQARKVTNDVMQLPRDRLADGIQSTKTMFSRIWINKLKCEELYDDLVNYRREFDNKLGIFSDKPIHDKHSHSADAFRYISYYKESNKDISPTAHSNGSPFTFRG